MDGFTFYIKSSTNNYYWSTVNGSNAANTRLSLQNFTGDTHQIYKFVYNSEKKFFYIQPAVGYADNLNRRIAIRWVSGTEHADRRVFLKDAATVYRQQFWVVKTGSVSGRYKIVPVSSNGTMTITNRANYLNQYYTSSSTTSGADVWQLETTKKQNSAVWCDQIMSNWCWAAAARVGASSETPFSGAALADGVAAVKGNTANDAGSLSEVAQAANFFMDGNKYSGNFTILENQGYSEYRLRKHIVDDHSVQIAMQPKTGVGHMIVIVGFEWIDVPSGTSPGYYEYLYFDSDKHDITYHVKYDTLMTLSTDVTQSYASKWTNSIAYSSSYVNDTIALS